jgi:hypothetical protein
MSAATATTITTASEPLPTPRTIVDAFDATAKANAQRAATEERLAVVTDYSFPELLPRASLVTVLGGVMAFVTFAIAAPLTLHTALTRIHHTTLQLTGFSLFALIVLNLGLGYGASQAHEWLHATTCRLMGGNPTLARVGQYQFAWSATEQGFTRKSYAAVLLAPLVVVTLLWVILLLALPNVAAFLIGALVVNMALTSADLWTLVVALRQPEQAVIFADRHPGFVAYAIAAPKLTTKKTVTVPKKKPAR